MKSTPSDRSRPVSKESLSHSVFTSMQDDLRHGVWSNHLPGIRNLMKRYMVSRPPVEEALRQLESLGWVGPAAKGVPRTILRTQTNDTNTSIILVRPPSEKLTRLSSEVLSSFLTILHSRNVEVQQIPLNEHLLNDETRQNIRTSHLESGCKRLLGLDMTHHIMRDLFPSSMPLLQIGARQFEDPHCASISLNMSKAVKIACLYSLQNGCRDISLAEIGLPPGMKHRFAPAVEDAYAEMGRRFQAHIHTPVLEPSKIGSTLRSVAQKETVDLILTVKAPAWNRTVYELQKAGITCPVKNILTGDNFKLFDSPPALISPIYDDYDKALTDWLDQLDRGAVPDFSRFVKMTPLD
ncbi:GntR family transcriptional regulator [Verrucomicrobiaceae bacterium N1E253]|uniref:GntR family transcriptional regulator n=1 Tax=Oceaniferula marina TaxID=2748318 RepID=A0A851GEU5_9BACT|nr:GntR family transcriptional regulator [Oceaniferula marina]NWK55709.1 GntR family transcriptional regulator [Oceaniferula marina]